MTPALTYTILLPTVHTTEWDAQLQQAVTGWQIRALWAATGNILPVFVPDTHYTPENVDTLIRAAGAVDEQVAALGNS